MMKSKPEAKEFVDMLLFEKGIYKLIKMMVKVGNK